MTSNKKKDLIFALLPFLIAVLIMLPRLLSPQFGLFDDGTMLIKANDISQGDFRMSDDLHAGRFRPLYWLYFTIVYAFAGKNPFWFFFSHLLILLILLLQIKILLRHLRAGYWQILITSLIFLFSIPIIENFYTLSKGEPLQLVFLLSSLIFFEKLKISTEKKTRLILIILLFISTLSAILVKETAIIIGPLIALVIGYMFLNRKHFLHNEGKEYIVFFGSILASIITYIILRWVWGTATITGGSYTGQYTFSISEMLVKSKRWATQLAYYFHYLIPLSALIIIIIIKKWITNIDQRIQLFFWGGWILLWLFILIPWQYAEVYYLLPFSLGLSVFIGVISTIIFKVIKENGLYIRTGLTTLLLLTAILMFLTLPNYWTHAKTQLAFDQANHQMLVHAIEIIPENGKVLIGIENENEYVQNIEVFLKEHYGRTDITYQLIDIETPGKFLEYSDEILIMPYTSNLPDLVVRAGIDEYYAMRFNESIRSKMGEGITELIKIPSGFQLFNVNLPVILCPILGEAGFCNNPDPLIDTRIFTYGWEVYKIQ